RLGSGDAALAAVPAAATARREALVRVRNRRLRAEPLILATPAPPTARAVTASRATARRVASTASGALGAPSEVLSWGVRAPPALAGGWRRRARAMGSTPAASGPSSPPVTRNAPPGEAPWGA